MFRTVDTDGTRGSGSSLRDWKRYQGKGNSKSSCDLHCDCLDGGNGGDCDSEVYLKK